MLSSRSVGSNWRWFTYNRAVKIQLLIHFPCDLEKFFDQTASRINFRAERPYLERWLQSGRRWQWRSPAWLPGVLVSSVGWTDRGHGHTPSVVPHSRVEKRHKNAVSLSMCWFVGQALLHITSAALPRAFWKPQALAWSRSRIEIHDRWHEWELEDGFDSCQGQGTYFLSPVWWLLRVRRR